MADPEVVSAAFGPLFAWAQQTGRMHMTEHAGLLAAAARDPYAVESEVRSRRRGLYAPSAPELPPPRYAAHQALAPRRGSVAAAAQYVPGVTGYAATTDPEGMDALMAEASATPPPGRQPTLFPEGDLPTITASGIDPRVLLQVPWQARPTVARAATTAAAYALMAEYAGPAGEVNAEMDSMPGGPLYGDVADYSRAYERWAGGFGS